MIRRVLQVLLPLAVLAAGAAMASKLAALAPEAEREVPAPPPPLVAAAAAEETTERVSVTSHGTVVPSAASRLVAEVAGRVVRASPRLAAGAFVAEGEVLVELDRRDHEVALAEARQAVAQAERRLAEERADADAARREWEELGRAGAPPPLVFREPQVAEAEASLAAARARLAKAELDLERTRIAAPYDARVQSESVDAGQFVARGEEVARLHAVDAAEVRVPIPLDDLAFVDLPLAFRERGPADGPGNGDVEEGPAVLLRARIAGREHEWEGRVVRTEAEIDRESRMLVAVVRVDDPYGRDPARGAARAARPPLVPGTFVEVEIEGEVARAVAFPRAALRGRDEVWVLSGERLEIRTVDVLRVADERVLVTAGVQPGERVVVTPLETVTEGMRVRIAAEDDR